jgi:hypothetical protein
MAAKHADYWTVDGGKDYLKSFAAIVYDDRNAEVKDNLLEAIGMEMDNIAPFCDEGRKNKMWGLLQGIDKTGYGAPVASRTEIIDSLMHEFGRVSNTVGLTAAEMIAGAQRHADEYKAKYPNLRSEIEKKMDETRFIIEDLYDDEVNLYGSTTVPVAVMATLDVNTEGFSTEDVYPSGIVAQEGFVGDWSDTIGGGDASGINFGDAKPSVVFTDLIPQERTLASPGGYRLDPGTADGTGEVFGIGLGDMGVSFPDMSEGEFQTTTYVNETQGGGGYYHGGNSLPGDIGTFPDNGMQFLLGPGNPDSTGNQGFTPIQEAELLLDTNYGDGTLFSGAPIRMPEAGPYNPNNDGQSAIYPLPSGLTLTDISAPTVTRGGEAVPGVTLTGIHGIGGNEGFSINSTPSFGPPVAALTPVDLSSVVEPVPGSIIGSSEAAVEFM